MNKIFKKSVIIWLILGTLLTILMCFIDVDLLQEGKGFNQFLMALILWLSCLSFTSPIIPIVFCTSLIYRKITGKLNADSQSHNDSIECSTPLEEASSTKLIEHQKVRPLSKRTKIFCIILIVLIILLSSMHFLFTGKYNLIMFSIPVVIIGIGKLKRQAPLL